ncbi:glycosyltransferase family 4 protein [Pedobacter nyackensis]|uniref:Glycosyltransferase involved in cell wall bisynthesis n=1 Tax=Pedobacter nyackensis TaxID=475255 RepID=A0A1W2ELF2_9SPHI|nr:glycosyltransferase family 4 protein [Pedobacter nyackensis]SMD09958.1 Glycosyltransferase involved in cell wall bisynthesis [Pedobacter nyackensis]
MRVLVLYDYPPSPGGLATQGDLLYRGLTELGVDVYPVNSTSDFEKEWYYRWFRPDLVIGVGYWGHLSDLVLHPNKHGIMAVPWLVADGYIAKHQDLLNKLPLILVTSNWVKEMYVRDGINADLIEVLPVGCDTETFVPVGYRDPKIRGVRESLGLSPDQLMILTVGGDGASKGSREVMQALAQIDGEVPDWKYVCKVWPQPRTQVQSLTDRQLAVDLGIADKVSFVTNITSRNLMPYLIAACDIYAAPSRLEGFGMTQVEAGACEKPVVGIEAMGMLDTLVHNKTALLAKVATKVIVNEVNIPDGTESGNLIKILFDTPRTVDYRADVTDIAAHLKRLMMDKELRLSLGKAARIHVASHFDYRKVAKRLLEILKERLEII